MATLEYNLTGPQVEPEASYWLRCPSLKIVSLKELKKMILIQKGILNPNPIAPYPANESKEARTELNELKKYFNDREIAAAFDQNQLSEFLKDIKYLPAPIGAVLSKRRAGPIILNGGELARLFENETPGLWHRHVLNVLFDSKNLNSPTRDFSPPRQALIWAALDVAIASALMAVWHYKWLEKGIARRPRPVEVARTLDDNFLSKFNFKVLYDYEVVYNPISGNIEVDLTKKKISRLLSPGTPRHPAYASGHSTYSAAASYVLGELIPTLKPEFDKLADNIGVARLWGGVHWKSDHIEGQKIGKAVGKLIIQQLTKSGIPNTPNQENAPPSLNDLEQRAVMFSAKCGHALIDLEGSLNPLLVNKVEG